MTPAFASWDAFFTMNGYAFHVWTSALITVAVMLVLWGLSLYQNKKCVRAVERQMALTQKFDEGDQTL